jgi:hypothetical protein
MAAKRLEAFLRDEAMPHPCQLFVEWSPRLYAIAVGLAAEQTACAVVTASRPSIPPAS